MTEIAAKRQPWLVLGSVAAALGFLILALVTGETFPERASLVATTGVPEGVHRARSSVQFRLSGHAHGFRHLSRHGSLDGVEAALTASSGAPVSVLFEAAAGSRDRIIYELRRADRIVLGYDQAKESWLANQTIGQALGWVFLSLGVGLGVFGWRRRP